MESPGPADAFLECGCGSRHWGLLGAAGLLLWRSADAGPEVLLQLRADWSHDGGTWAFPGGAIQPGESAIEAALREAREETGLRSLGVTVRHLSTLRHPDWAYHTVVAEAVGPLGPRLTNDETAALEWVPAHSVAERELHHAFRESWTQLARLLRRPVLVVDAANVVGSRPDGWWKDRAGAATRLLGHLAVTGSWPASALGFPAEVTWPEVHVVLEGQARGATDPGDALAVHRAPGEGDETILELAVKLQDEGGDVVVATADRGLRHWLETAGVRATGPRAVWGGDGGARRGP